MRQGAASWPATRAPADQPAPQAAPSASVRPQCVRMNCARLCVRNHGIRVAAGDSAVVDAHGVPTAALSVDVVAHGRAQDPARPAADAQGARDRLGTTWPAARHGARRLARKAPGAGSGVGSGGPPPPVPDLPRTRATAPPGCGPSARRRRRSTVTEPPAPLWRRRPRRSACGHRPPPATGPGAPGRIQTCHPPRSTSRAPGAR